MKANMRRITKEFETWKREETPEGMKVSLPDEEDKCRWNVEFQGSKESVWKGETFTLELTFPPSYPFRPFSLRFSGVPPDAEEEEEEKKKKKKHKGAGENDATAVNSWLARIWTPKLTVMKVLERLRKEIQWPNIQQELSMEMDVLKGRMEKTLSRYPYQTRPENCKSFPIRVLLSEGFPLPFPVRMFSLDASYLSRSTTLTVAEWKRAIDDELGFPYQLVHYSLVALENGAMVSAAMRDDDVLTACRGADGVLSCSRCTYCAHMCYRECIFNMLRYRCSLFLMLHDQKPETDSTTPSSSPAPSETQQK